MSNSTCTRCPRGTYQPRAGSITCLPCTEVDLTTFGEGTRSKDDCRAVPKYHLNPNSPQKTPVAATIWWYKYLEPQQDERLIGVYLSVIFEWRDDRVLGVPLLHSRTKSGRSTPEQEWRDLGMWLPSFTVFDLDSNTTTDSKIEVAQEYNASVPHRFEVKCLWSFRLAPATFQWYVQETADYRLDWRMFPFGAQQLPVRLQCNRGASCSLNDVTDGTGMGAAPSDPEVTAENSANSSYARRQALAVKSIRSGGSASSATLRVGTAGGVSFSSSSGEGLASDQFPLINSEIGLSSPLSQDTSILITITMRRIPTLYIIRLCLPLGLVIMVSLYFFYLGDSYHQLDLTFNSLLVIALLAIEVKDFMPDHVTVVTWIDWFVTMNVLLIVFAVGMSLSIIVLEESSRPLLKAWSGALDRAVRWTQPVGVFVVNCLMLMLAYSNDYVSVNTVETYMWAAFGANLLACFILFIVEARQAKPEADAVEPVTAHAMLHDETKGAADVKVTVANNVVRSPPEQADVKERVFELASDPGSTTAARSTAVSRRTPTWPDVTAPEVVADELSTRNRANIRDL